MKSPVVLSLVQYAQTSAIHLGIGKREVLERFNLPIKVDLPGVGENLQVSKSRWTFHLRAYSI